MRTLPLLLAALPVAAQADQLNIITDIAPVQSLVMQVAGDRANVDVLLDPNADPHHFQLRPSQARTLAQADFLFWIGEDMTPWLERAKDGVAPDLPHLAFLEAEDHHEDEDDHDADHGHEDDHGDEDGHEDEHGHDHGGVDPHIWLNTHEAEEMLHMIAEHLAEIDPEGAEYYEHNAHEAAEAIDELTHEVEHLLEDVTDAPFAVTHEGYNFFVDQFGLNQLGSIKDVHDSAASAGHVSDLAHYAEDGEIVCIFGEVGDSNKLAEVLVEQGAKLGGDLDPAGIALERGPQLYSDLIMDLATKLKDCLAD